MPEKALPLKEDADNGALRYNTSIASKQDPSALTTQQLLRENFWLRELLETRIDGMDKAIMLLQAFADRTPTTMDIQHEVTALREVAMEMFRGIKTQLLERDAQTEKASRDVKSAVDAAFAAAKEAVGEQNKSNALSISKSEVGFTKQIDGIVELIRTTSKAVDDKIGDLKERVTQIESRTQGAQVQKVESQTNATQSWGFIVGGIGILVSVATLIVLVVTRFSH